VGLPWPPPASEHAMAIRDWYRRSAYLRHEPLLRDLPRRRELIERAVRPGERVLDVGCLGGALLEHVAGHAVVVGVDVIPEALLQAGQRGFRPVHADASQPLPFASGAFDLVHAGEVLEHLFDPLALLRELRRVCKPGGRLIGTVPNVANLGDRARMVLGRAPTVLGAHPDAPAGDHIRALTVARLDTLAQQAGWVGPGWMVAIATGGVLPLRWLKELRAQWADLIWFEYER